MKKEVKIILSSDEYANKKGGVFEDMIRTIVSREGYEITQNLNFAGLEIDLLANHKVRKHELLYVECKAKQKPASTEIKNFSFGVNHKDASHGYFIHTEELDHQAAALSKEIQDSEKPEYKKLSFIGPSQIISILVSADFIEPLNLKQKNKKLTTKLTLALTYFGKFYVYILADNNLPSAFGVVNASDSNIAVDDDTVKLLRESIRDLEGLEYLPNSTSGKSTTTRTATELDTISEVATGEKWYDYKPTNPDYFVGRDNLLKSSFDFLESVKAQTSNKRVLEKQFIKFDFRVAVVFIVSLIIVAVLHSYAVSAEAVNTLKVSPVRSDIEAKQGESTTVKTVVTNLTDKDIMVRASTNDFVAGDESGTPALVLDADKFAPSHSLKRFMEPIGDVTIPAKKSAVVEVNINVPKTAKAGGYFGAVRFAPTTPDSGGQVNLSASVASIILLTVPGDMTEKLNLTNFDFKQGDNKHTFFMSGKDISAAFRFYSTSSAQVGPFGKVSVQKGDKVVYAADFNAKTPRDMVLPESARRWDVPLKNVEEFGKYTVSATFTYGTKNQTIDVTKTFWVVPQAYIIGAIVALVVLIAIIALVIWLIARARKNRKPSKSVTRGRN